MSVRGLSGSLDGGVLRPPQHAFAEKRASDFLARLQEAVEDDIWHEILPAFTTAFREVQNGVLDHRTAKNLVANLLADTAPAMLPEFLEVFDTACDSESWAGKAALDYDRWAAMRSGALNTDPLARDSFDRRSTGSRQTHRDWKAISAHLVPEGRGQFVIWFMIVNSAVILGMFAFMAGDYPMWIRQNKAYFIDTMGFSQADYQAAINSSDVGGLIDWLSWSTTTWRVFPFPVLLAWGGRYLPKILDGQWWRWFTSIYIHVSVQHIAANMLLFLSLVSHLELNYGFWRITLVWIISGVGGNLVGATFEDHCTLVAGASGAVFGLMGLFIADVMLNFESISRPFLRIIMIVCFSVLFAVTVFTQKSHAAVSHWSHIGGLVCGLFPSFVFLPNVMDKRWKAVQTAIQDSNRPRNYNQEGAATRQRREERIQRHQAQAQEQLKPSWWSTHFPFNPLLLLSAVIMIAVFICLPIYIYSRHYDNRDCDPVPAPPAR